MPQTAKLDKILCQIKFCRKEKELTQAKLGDALKVDRTTYVRKERGLLPLTLKEFLVIADFLDIPPEDFFKLAVKTKKKH